jgi:hypothetical protein
MVEVFRTDVPDSIVGKLILYALHRQFPSFTANFDFHDCDKILRVKSNGISIEHENIISFLRGFGFKAEPLPD